MGNLCRLRLKKNKDDISYQFLEKKYKTDHHLKKYPPKYSSCPWCWFKKRIQYRKELWAIPKSVPWSTFKNSESHFGTSWSFFSFSFSSSSSALSSLCFLKFDYKLRDERSVSVQIDRYVDPCLLTCTIR